MMCWCGRLSAEHAWEYREVYMKDWYSTDLMRWHKCHAHTFLLETHKTRRARAKYSHMELHFKWLFVVHFSSYLLRAGSLFQLHSNITFLHLCTDGILRIEFGLWEIESILFMFVLVESFSEESLPDEKDCQNCNYCQHQYCSQDPAHYRCSGTRTLIRRKQTKCKADNTCTCTHTYNC